MEKEPASDGLFYRHPKKDSRVGGRFGRSPVAATLRPKRINCFQVVKWPINPLLLSPISRTPFLSLNLVKKRLIQESKLSNWKAFKWSATHCLMLSLFFNLMESKTFLEVDGLEGNIFTWACSLWVWSSLIVKEILIILFKSNIVFKLFYSCIWYNNWFDMVIIIIILFHHSSVNFK